MVIGTEKLPKQKTNFHVMLRAEKTYNKFTSSNQLIYTLQILLKTN